MLRKQLMMLLASLAFALPALAQTGGRPINGSQIIPGTLPNPWTGGNGTAGQCLISNGSPAPTFQSCGGLSPAANNTVIGNTSGSTGVPSAITDLSPLTTTIQGGSIPRLLSARADDVYNVADYGAFVCDGATDNSSTINAAISAWRTAVNLGKPATLFFPKVGAGQCVITGTINGTGLRGNFSAINGNSIILLCKATGIPCWDATGSRFVTYRDLIIQGDTTNIPSIGMQIVRQTAAIDCPENNLDNIKIKGSFSFASFYNMSCETNVFIKPEFLNSNTGANAYALVMDGDNHFNASSAFQTVTLPATTQQSFNENNFYSLVAKNSGGGHVIWLEGTTRHRYFSGYSLTTNGTTQPVVLYDEGQGHNLDLDIDIHVETAVTDVFLISGSNATPILTGFHWYDQSPQVTNSFFKLDTGVTGATITDGSIRVASTSFGGTGVQVFDAPSAWNVASYVYIPAASNWATPPASFIGTLCEGATCSLTDTTVTAITLTATAALNAASVNGTSSTSPFQYAGSTMLWFPPDSLSDLSYCLGSGACLNANFSNSVKGYVTAIGEYTCGGAGTGMGVGQTTPIENTCIAWRAGSNLGNTSQFNTIVGVGSLRYGQNATNVSIFGVDDLESGSVVGAWTYVDVNVLATGNMRFPHNIQQVNSMGNGGTLQGQTSTILNLLNIFGYGDFTSTSATQLDHGVALGDMIGTGATGLNHFTLIGYNVAHANCATGTDILIIDSGTHNPDCVAGGDAHFANIDNIIKITGTGTPSTSTTTITGALVAKGGTVVTDLAAPADVQTFSASGTWTENTTKGTPTLIKVICIGAGGGGGGGITTTSGTASSGGGGGGGGSYWEMTMSPTTSGTSQTVTMGAAGTGGAPGTSGTAGGNSSFGALVDCYGGGGGAVGQSAANSGGGGGAGNRTVGTSVTSTTGGAGGSNSGSAGGAGAAGTVASASSGGAGGGGGLNGGVGQINGLAYCMFCGASGGASGGGVSTTPGAFAGGDALQPLIQTHLAGGAAGTSANAGNGAAGSTAQTVGWQPGDGGAGGGSAISTFVGGNGGAGNQGGGGGGGGSALSTGTAGSGGNGGAPLIVVITFY